MQLTNLIPSTETICLTSPSIPTPKMSKSISTWGGAVIVNPVGGTTFRSVEATFRVPTLQPPQDQPTATKYGADVWVGFDGSNRVGNRNILQAGVGLDYGFSTPDQQSTSIWMEWHPDPKIFLDTKFHRTVNVGDEVYIKVTATSNSTGQVLFRNITQNYDINDNIQAPVVRRAVLPVEGCIDHAKIG